MVTEPKITEPKIIDVEMTGLRISSAPNILVSLGVGSSLVVTIYDFEKRIGGMAHAMLPDSTKVSHTNPHRFVDKAVETILEELEKLGSKRQDLEAKVVGGANMFEVLSSGPEGIGGQNIEAAKEKLAQEEIKIAGSDSGGNSGRSVEFDLQTGLVTIKTRI